MDIFILVSHIPKMSFGFGPKDILDTGKGFYGAGAALRNNEDGVRHRFEVHKASEASRKAAITNLINDAPSLGAPQPLLHLYTNFEQQTSSKQKKIDKLGKGIGIGTKKHTLQGIGRELQFEFETDKELIEAEDRVRAQIDAIRLETERCAQPPILLVSC